MTKKSVKQAELVLKKAVLQIHKGLDRHHKLASKGFEVGIKKAGLFLLRESMKIVPVDTGALRASGPATTHAEGTGFGTIMVVGYGVHYAIYVHENLEAKHKEGKTAKYLTGPMEAHRKDLTKIVIDEIHKRTAKTQKTKKPKP